MKQLILILALALTAPIAFAQSLDISVGNHNGHDHKFKQERIEHREGRFFHRDREVEFTYHPRHYWVHRYGNSMKMIDGCWYYNSGNCWYPARGYDPSCQYEGIAYCE